VADDGCPRGAGRWSTTRRGADAERVTAGRWHWVTGCGGAARRHGPHDGDGGVER
jgi:hypothetical protein